MDFWLHGGNCPKFPDYERKHIIGCPGIGVGEEEGTGGRDYKETTGIDGK